METLVNNLIRYGKILAIKDDINFTLLMKIENVNGAVGIKIFDLVAEYASNTKILDLMVSEDDFLLIVLKPKQVVIFQLPDNGRT